MNNVQSPRLNLDAIRQCLAGGSTHDSGGNIYLFDLLDSTNTWLLKNGQSGDVCLSEAQTAGRGRRGNQWVSPDVGNIYFSLCWCFEEMTDDWSFLGLLSGVAVAEALSDAGLSKHGVKWPNDIFWNDRKLGGLLLESQNQTGRIVVGVGININSGEQAYQGISQPWVGFEEAYQAMRSAAPRQDLTISREKIIAALITRLSRRFNGFADFSFESFLDDWKKWDILSGRRVAFQQQGKTLSGVVCGIDEKGRVGIVSHDQTERYYSSADIRLLRT